MSNRDDKGRWMPGQSGGGVKPKGAKNRPKPERLAEQAAKERLSAMLGQALEVVEASMAANHPDALQAAKLVLAKAIPDSKSPGTYVDLPGYADPALSLEQRAQVLDDALADGRLSVEQHATLSRALESRAKFTDLARIELLLSHVREGKTLAEALAITEGREPAATEGTDE
ncbi:MAG: hypothetical protein K9L70_12405 [Thiohalocapsa sp.]|nr:hypothetical protein [Thiohalocapsa sp.]MCF7992240.1 hypothetical protein [Thiohalocapsa sp.]